MSAEKRPIRLAFVPSMCRVRCPFAWLIPLVVVDALRIPYRQSLLGTAMEQSEHDLAESRLAKPAAPPEPRDAGPVFTTKNVSIYYSSFKAVTDVSMTIYEKEITALIGSSGSVKRRCCGPSTA